MIKNFFLIIIFSLICNFAFAKDKYVGRGELILEDVDIDWFMKYLSPPAGQSPMVFMVAAEDGKAIWSFYYYCPEGSCKDLNKLEATKRCANSAEKYYKDKKDIECFIFAKERVVVWDNDINPAHWKKSAIKSKWSRSEVESKLKEFGFYN